MADLNANDFKYPRSKILVFAKAPIAGQVKTRMQPVLNPEQSVELHMQLLHHTLAMLNAAKLSPVQLCFAGQHPCWQTLQQQYAVELVEQSEGDLGQRMAYAATAALAEVDSIILLGADCPFMSKNYLDEAFTLLDTGPEVVFGPANDGGYVMLAMRQFRGELFEGINWGSDEVLVQSCHQLATSYTCLSFLDDIDRPEDIGLLATLPAFKHWLSYAQERCY